MGRRDLVVTVLLGGFGVTLLMLGIWGTFLRPADPAGAPDAARVTDPALDAPAPATPAGALWSDRTGSGSSAASTAAQSPLPKVLEMLVCDASVDCGSDPSQTIWFEVTACLRTTPEGSNRPLRLVVTGRDAPPVDLDDPWVFARSGEVRGMETLTCHPVRVVGAPLVQREYWLWVLADSTVLGRARFSYAR